MKEIRLTQGLFTMVDDEDFEYLNQWKWHAVKGTNTFYAMRSITLEKNKQKQIQMHRVIMNANNGMVTDHRDRNGLNNQRYNLRNITQHANLFNTNSKGYSFHKANGKYVAQIRVNKKQIHIGYFDKKEDARMAYLKAKEKYHVISEKCARLKIKVVNYPTRKETNGYYLNKPTGKYQAQIWVNSKNKHLGLFDTPQEARQAYLKAKAQLIKVKRLREKVVLIKN